MLLAGGASHLNCLNSSVNSRIIMLKLQKLVLVATKRFYLYQCTNVYREQWRYRYIFPSKTNFQGISFESIQ